MPSIEEKIEEYYKYKLDSMNIRHYGKTERINQAIYDALQKADSKSGGNGANYPDIQLLIHNNHQRYIPVMIEAKGLKNKLVKFDKNQEIVGVTYYEQDSKPNSDGVILHHKGDANYTAVKQYAVNGAVHYGEAILNEGTYKEVIVIGINGTTLNDFGKPSDPECIAYYISEKNRRIPKQIQNITSEDWSLLKQDNINKLFKILDDLNLTDSELDALTRKTEATLEEKIKSMHQSLYDDVQLKTALSTNEKLYLFCGLIMSGLKIDGVRTLAPEDLSGNDDERNNDGIIILRNIESFLYKKNCSVEKVNMIIGLLEGVFKKQVLWRPRNGISLLRTLFQQVKTDIIPCLEAKIKKIKETQLLGIEILGNIYILAVLNMILMGDGSSNMLNEDSHDFDLPSTFPANVFLLNPPYSAPGKGFIFVEEALNQMTDGYACILIQDSSGSGQGLPYTKRILKNNTLEASIKMPSGLFGNKASVSVCIFVIKVNRPHEEDDIVTFIDFSEDGYTRQNRKKSTQEINLRNTDHAEERYDEIVAHVLGKKPKTSYYSEQNGKIIKDTITLNGDDWNFNQHQKIDTTPTEEDFKKTVADYLSWKVSQLMKENI